MNVKGTFGEILGRNEENLLETGGKAILIIKLQRTWMNCVLFNGK